MSDPTAATSRAALARLVWTEVKASGLRQVEIAANADITEKHLSQIMRGHVVGSWEVIDAVLAACGRELVLGTRLLLIEGSPTTTTDSGGAA